MRLWGASLSDRHTPSVPEPESRDERGLTKDLLGPPESVQGKRLAKLVRERGPVPAASSTLRTIAGSGAVVTLARQTSIGWEKLRRSDTALAATVTGISAVGIVVAAFVIGSPSPQADPPAPTLVLGTATATGKATVTAAGTSSADVPTTAAGRSAAASGTPSTDAIRVGTTATEIPLSTLPPGSGPQQSSTAGPGSEAGSGPQAPTATAGRPTATSSSGATHQPPTTHSPTSSPPQTKPPTSPTSTSPTPSPTPPSSPTPTDTATPPATTTDPPPPPAATTVPPATATTAG